MYKPEEFYGRGLGKLWEDREDEVFFLVGELMPEGGGALVRGRRRIEIVGMRGRRIGVSFKVV